MKRKIDFILIFTAAIALMTFWSCSKEPESGPDYIHDFGDIEIIEDSNFTLTLTDPTANELLSGMKTCNIAFNNTSEIGADKYRNIYLIVDDNLDFINTPYKFIKNTTSANQTLDLNTFTYRNGVHTVQPWLRIQTNENYQYILGNKVTVAITNEFVTVTNMSDGYDDWHGTLGDLLMPIDAGTDGTYLDGLQDILNFKVVAAGPNIELYFTMSNHSTAWSPSYGFDHVSFHVYFDNPATTGTDVMPSQKSAVPMGDWDYLLLADGWSKNVYSSEGADASTWGTSSGNPQVEVDDVSNIVKFTIFGDAFGGPATLSGWTIYVTTFDVDGTSGTIRPVLKDATGHAVRSTNYSLFDGSTYTNAYILDWIDPITLDY